jgi:antitoxin component YwqK of YwqJK toxin-antitoxin module
VKRICILTSILFLSRINTNTAQPYTYTGTSVWNSIFHYENSEQEANRKAGIKAKTTSWDKRSEIKYLYDTAGRLTDYQFGKKKRVSTSYLDDGRKSKVAYYKKEKLIELDSFVWNGKLLQECDMLDERQVIFQRQRYKYDSIYVVEYVNEKLKRGKFREKRKQITEYYPDHTYKRVTYFKNGKPDYFTVFDCNPAGQNHKVQKDSTYYCLKEDVDSLGNKTKVTISNFRNQSIKKIEYFNAKNERIADKTYDLKRGGEIMWEYYYKRGKPFLYEKFISYKKGKEYYRVENKFDVDDRIIESSTAIRGKLSRTSKSFFNERNLLSKTETYNRRNKLKRETRFTYEYY